MTRRFIIVASALILIAAVVGGTIGRSRRFRHTVPTAGSVSYTEAADIEKDYNEAVAAITVEYAGDIDCQSDTWSHALAWRLHILQNEPVDDFTGFRA